MTTLEMRRADALRADPPSLVCPKDHQSLERLEDRLACPSGHEFTIRNRIPRFVPTDSYADHFGAQWNRYRTSQLDSYTGHPVSEERASRAVGAELRQSLSGRRVLEVGCGAGRFTEVLLAWGAHVTSTDISSAVEANAKNFEGRSGHRAVQADVRALPFSPGQFDLVFCLGVVQHTPSPEETITALFEQVRPGGTLVFDHYRHNLSTYTKVTEPLLRRALRRVSTKTGLQITERLVSALLPAHRLAARVPMGQQLLSRISPVRAYFHAYPEFSDDLQREWAMVDTHDALTSWYRHHRSPAALERFVCSLGAENVAVDEDPAFAIVRAIKPLR